MNELIEQLYRRITARGAAPLPYRNVILMRAPVVDAILARIQHDDGPQSVPVAFQKRVCDPLANTLFHHRPTKTATLPAKIEAAYHKADVAIQNVTDLLAA